MFNLEEFRKKVKELEKYSITSNYIFQDIFFTIEPYDLKKKHMEDIISVLKNSKQDIK